MTASPTDHDPLPERHGAPWSLVDPATADLDPAALARAVAYAEAHETPWPRDLEAHLAAAAHFEPPPHNTIIGPIRPRGAPNGVILRHGRPVARWGDTRQIDFTFSVAKSYLGILTGLAVEDGLIPDLDAPIARLVRDGGFDGPRNGQVTWRQMLQQTSEWEGTLWDKSDVIDRNRQLGVEGRGNTKGDRVLQAPGAFWEYNDVRVNRMSLALLRVYGRALPDVFRERIMDPIGASPDWEWHGYRNSWVEIGGKQVQSVSGGTHWGGGILIHAEDQARVGELVRRRGSWGGRQLIPERWIDESIVPCALNPLYGLMWWLNTAKAQYPSASAESIFFKGAGGNITWIDPPSGIVAALRWIDPDKLDGFLKAVMAAVRG